MTILEAVVLAAVQGATEFLPVSSSGHLVLAREFTGWSDQGGLFFDTLLHASSLFAVLVYFWRDWVEIFKVIVLREGHDKLARFYRMLPLYLIVATIPAAVVGLLWGDYLESMRMAWAVGTVMILAGCWFLFCEKHKHESASFGWKTVVSMGIAQMFALFCGASRSGMTTGTGMLCGQHRAFAARFSFFMAIPAITGALIVQLADPASREMAHLSTGVVAAGFFSGLLVSLFCVHFCLTFFRKHSLKVFAWYLFAVGGFSIVFDLFLR